MGISYGELKYKYKIKIDLEGLVDKIIEKLDVSYDDWYFEDGTLHIEGREQCRYKNWHCAATMLDPEEDETDLIGSVDDKNMEKAVLDAVSEYKEWLSTTKDYIAECEIDEDSYDYIEDEPDPDLEYDRWRDRQLEDE